MYRSAQLPILKGRRAAANAAHLIRLHHERIGAIYNVQDSHVRLHSAHTIRWRLPDGSIPKPFTEVRLKDLDAGEILFKAADGDELTRMRRYLAALERKGLVHRLWPMHCVIGTWGHNVYHLINDAYQEWELASLRSVDYTMKGQALIEEHFGAIEAEVENLSDHRTLPNRALLKKLYSSRRLVIVGLALDICVKRTVEQMLAHVSDGPVSGLGREFARKLVFLTDCTAAIDVAEGDAFLARMREMGATVTTSREFVQ